MSSKKDLIEANIFSSDYYKYKFLRLKITSKTILTIVGLVNGVIGTVATLLAILL